MLDPSMSSQIVATDYFSYAVLNVCQSYYGLVNFDSFLVLTREKQPSMYSRKKILESLKGQLGMNKETILGLTKGNIHECWGDDQYL